MAPVFYSNLPDDNHCLQASLMMVLNSLGHPTSWEEVNKLTKYDDRYYSWTIVAASVLSNIIPNVKLITTLNYENFAKKGVDYLCIHWTSKRYITQSIHASPNFTREQQFAREFKGKYDLRSSNLTAKELKDLLKNNLIIAFIDPFAIRNENGSAGHFVVMFGNRNGKFIYHDPGLPAIENAEVEESVFLKACGGEFLIIPIKE